MTHPPAALWRVFPWDRTAAAGEPFSSRFVPESRGNGRFDVRGRKVLYLAEEPAHAVAEKLQRYRGHTLEDSELREWGHPLALAKVRLADSARSGVVDLCDPERLVEHGLRPDLLQAVDRGVTQDIARELYDGGCPGFRWWSSLRGEWHNLTLFMDRLVPGFASDGPLSVGQPVVLRPESPEVREAALALGIRLGG